MLYFVFFPPHFIYFVLHVAVFQHKIATHSRLLLEVGHCSCRHARLISYHRTQYQHRGNKKSATAEADCPRNFYFAEKSRV